ncbi:hypothetical protein NIES2104_45170 [Leptolyngbya sp. NIES-2104]|nr:hypothetical protein NIES2104_45170 [Leptolyngbya sp. NIES-2104]
MHLCTLREFLLRQIEFASPSPDGFAESLFDVGVLLIFCHCIIVTKAS